MASTTALLTSQQPTDKSPLRDFRQEVTDNIVRMLERGVAPWQKPWEPGAGSVCIPFNPTSERAYRGGNAIHLMATGLQREYEDPRSGRPTSRPLTTAGRFGVVRRVPRSSSGK